MSFLAKKVCTSGLAEHIATWITSEIDRSHSGATN
jgi:hypothetical protein